MTENPVGRPKIEINWNIVNSCLESGCTGVEVAAKIGIHPTSLYARVKEDFNMNFTDYSLPYYSKGIADLRMAQHRKALDNNHPGNVQMLMHLGKHRCGQEEREHEKSNYTIEVSHGLAAGTPIRTETVSTESDPSPELGDQESPVGSP